MLSAQHVHEPPLHTVLPQECQHTTIHLLKKRKINVFKGYNTNKCSYKNLTVKA